MPETLWLEEETHFLKDCRKQAYYIICMKCRIEYFIDVGIDCT